jgi:hypothetical protein
MPEDKQHIHYVRKKDPPFFFHRGEGFVRQRLPEGTRVIYPPPAMAGLPDLRASLRAALENPLEADPLSSQLKPGMKVSIAFDDISLPTPPMQPPDVRAIIMEELIGILDEAGVEDVHLINAIGLHRKNTPAEMRNFVGPKIFERFFPHRLYNHDAEDPGGIVSLGFTDQGEESTFNRRAAESDLLIYVNITSQPMSGGYKSFVVGLGSYRTIKHNHNARVMSQDASYMDPPRSELHHSIGRLGRLVEKHVKVFKVETSLNSNIFPWIYSYQQKREREWNVRDYLLSGGQKFVLACLPNKLKRVLYQSTRSPYRVTSIFAGRNEPVHEKTLQAVQEQQMVHVKGQADILICGIPYLGPYNVNSIMNPLLVHSLGLGYFFNFSIPKPLVRRGGVLILMHPLRYEFDRVHHYPYVEFFEKVLAETRDPVLIDEKYADAFASKPEYIEAYRFKYSFHGAHPIYMWNWACRGMAHLGLIIAVAPQSAEAARRLGYEIAPSFEAALGMAMDFLSDRKPEITYSHLPPIFLCSVE